MEKKMWLRPSDLAAEMGRTTTRIYQLQDMEGGIPFVRQGRSRLTSRTDWEQWLASLKKDPRQLNSETA